MQYSIRENLRIARTRSTSTENIVVVDNATDAKYMINRPMYDIIRYINQNDIPVDDLSNALQREFKFDQETLTEIINYLRLEKVIIPTNEKKRNPNILDLYQGKYILNRIALEITEHCNLRCRHCYGGYGGKAPKTLTLDFISSLMPELDKLNAHSVMLTGGEFFLHPNYKEIFALFKSRGYSLSLLTNGLLSDKVKTFIADNRDVSFVLKVSLDGFEDKHNYLRGNKQSYQKAVETLTYLKSCPHVKVYISTSLGKDNIDEIRDFRNFVNKEFGFNTTTDLVFPTEHNRHFHKRIFQQGDFDELNCRYPEYFKNKITKGGPKTSKNNARCVAAIEMATLTADKTLKICNNAVADRFHFGSLEQSSLTELWEHPPAQIDFFRQERNCDVAACRQCRFYDRCVITNCRTLAYYYTGNHGNPNPIVCYAQSKYNNENNHP